MRVNKKPEKSRIFTHTHIKTVYIVQCFSLGSVLCDSHSRTKISGPLGGPLLKLSCACLRFLYIQVLVIYFQTLNCAVVF